MNKFISVIIPTFNEEKCIKICIESLSKQSYPQLEVIVVDDGSTDDTIKILKSEKCTFYLQNHRGPGIARNLGAQKAKGDILVFVDADMTFEKDFIKDLTKPILEKKTIGTFSKNELVLNANDRWSVCWNINRNVPRDRMLAKNFPDKAQVFRAILKTEFERVNGFDVTGDYTDDWSLWEKLHIKSTLAKGAIYYHINPNSLEEVWNQASWIGKNKFISGNLFRKIKSLIIYNLVFSLILGVYKSIRNSYPLFVFFKIIYDFAIWNSVIKMIFTSKNRYK